jgi:hypothetical protein
MTFVYRAFTESDIINAINNELSQQKVRAVSVISIDDNVAQLKTARGALLVAILGGSQPYAFFVRSVNRVINKKAKYRYLFNGQATGNLTTLAFSGELGAVNFASEEQYKSYLTTELHITSEDSLSKRISLLNSAKKAA